MAKNSTSWTPGKSGNPRGRRVDSAISRARKCIAANLPELIDILLAAARGGDVAAAKILLERLVPLARADFDELETRLERLESE